MDLVSAALGVGAGLVLAVAGGLLVRRLGSGGDGRRVSAVHEQARSILASAESEAEAKAIAYREREDIKLEERRREARVLEDRLTQRESTLEQRAANLTHREEAAMVREQEIEDLRRSTQALETQARERLERVAGVDAKAAKAQLLAGVEDEARRQAMVVVHDVEVKAKEEADRRASWIIAGAVQRLASSVVSDVTTSTVMLTSDDMKGRIIGKDGRNIRAFENLTGVNLVVDDTPEAVTLSSFDPVRREIARLMLEQLIMDGRIHPASIEEAHKKAKAEVDRAVRDAGEWALVDVRLGRMNPELVDLVGQLKYRTSYGQNVLTHLVETAHVAGMLAAELGADEAEARRAGLLHDIGKAVSHMLGGSHALVGAEIARRFGEEPSVVHAIEAHHGEVEPRTLLAVITQAADALSASRPGARREQLEAYVRRLHDLEQIAMSMKGVERVFAMQAGRQLRVVVDPGAIDDLGAAELARQLALRIEKEVSYPGQIQVVVVRELRATGYAR